MHHPYHHQPAAPAAAAIDLNPEAVIARQEAMIQAGTHAMIAEKLAHDAVFNQTQREAHIKPAVDIAPAVSTAPIVADTIV